MALEFVKYTGKWPDLCTGKLTIKEDDKEWTLPAHACISGGCVWFDDDWLEHVEYGPWRIDQNSLPDELKQRVDEISALMNDNVEEGCCGGCV